MTDSVSRCIAVSPPGEFATRAGLFRALEQLYPVRFVSSESETSRTSACIAAIVLDAAGLNQIVPVEGRRVFAAPANPADSPAVGKPPVEFASDPRLKPILRGRNLPDESDLAAPAIPSDSNQVVLARRAGCPVWIKRVTAGGEIDWIANPLPVLLPDQNLSLHLHRSRFLPLLPLLHWLDEVTVGWGWGRPPLRAAFMFDDPNLRSCTYGFIDYRELAAEAQTQGYHVSMATIPIDVGRIDPRAAALFRENAQSLSLLVHGNDHTHQELAGDYSSARRNALVAQALRRIERLERQANLRVSRVMAAPHGACNEPMARSLAAHGFESACISRGSLAAHNRGTRWPDAFGLQLAEVLGGSLPVFPRFRLARNCEPDVVLAAFLGQAIIPVGHHQDVRAGLDILGEVAAMINRLGPVNWGDLATISRAHFLHRCEGRSWFVRLYARVVELVVPEFVDDLHLELSWGASDEVSEVTTVVPVASAAPLEPVAAGRSRYAVSGHAGQRLRITVQSTAREADAGPHDPFRPWAFARRFLAESRDRMQPLLPSR